MTKRDDRIPVGNRVVICKRGRRGFYTADFHYRGQHRRQSLRTKSKKEAIDAAMDLDRRLRDGSFLLPQPLPAARLERVTIQRAQQEFLDDKRSGGKRPKTIAKYAGIFRIFAAFCDRQGLDQLTDVTLRTYDAFRQARSADVGQTQLFHDARALKELFAWCVDRDLMAVNPLQSQRFRRPKPQRKDRVLTLDEVDAILTAAPARIRAVLAVLAFTGMRSGNARHLRIEDVDFQTDWIYVRSRPGAETKTGNEWRTPVHPRLKQILLSQPRRREGYFFVAPPSTRYPEGGHWINTKHLNEDFQKVLRRLNLPAGRENGFTVHDLRHFFKSFCLTHGVPREYVDAWQGHENIKSASDLYVHTFDDASQEFMQRVPFGGAGPSVGVGDVSPVTTSQSGVGK